jgi:uncharacterized protein YndB with AHSA1/START domain
MTTVGGTREVAVPRERVWDALAVLRPYCAVCDVSYVVAGSPDGGMGTTFVCVPGRLDAGAPPDTAPRGEIVEWDPPRRVASTLTLTPETWTTRIELENTPDGGTRVTLTLTHEPAAGGRAVRWLQRGALRRLVQRTVDAELDKLSAHVEQAEAEP